VGGAATEGRNVDVDHSRKGVGDAYDRVGDGAREDLVYECDVVREDDADDDTSCAVADGSGGGDVVDEHDGSSDGERDTHVVVASGA